MEIPVPKFQAKTETEMKDHGVIKTVLTKLYDTENDLIKKRRLAFEDLKNVIPKDGKNVEKEEEKEEEKKGKKKDKKYSSLKEIFDAFSNTMQELEDEKEKQVLKIKTKLIPSTEAHITETKKTKNKVSQISLTTKNDIKDIKDNIMQYEADRIQNNKKIMLHLINYEMAYHAKYIEKLTELFNDIKSSNLTKSIKESLMSVGVSQNVYDDDNANEESEKNEDDEGDDDDNKLLKSSKLSKSKKSSTKKSKNESHKNDAEDDDDEEEKDDD